MPTIVLKWHKGTQITYKNTYDRGNAMIGTKYSLLNVQFFLKTA